MKRIKNFGNVQASTDSYKKLGPGGYVCKIKKVEDVPEKQYLRIEFDIAEGEYTNYFADRQEWLAEKCGNDSWPRDGVMYRSYKESALPMFKAFITAIDESSDTSYAEVIEDGDFNEQKLAGKRVGLVLREEENVWNGKLSIRLSVASVRSVQKIRDGDFSVPPLKKADGVQLVNLDDEDEGDLPF